MNELHLTPLGMKAVFPINDDLCQLLGFTTPPKRVEVGVEDHFAAGWNAAVRYMREHPDPVNSKDSSIPGDIVLDPFAGCGSTMEAALSCGRNFVGFEINPQWRAN